MRSATAASSGRQALNLFPRGVDRSSIIFYGSDQVEILPDDLALLQDKLIQSKDYFIVEEITWNSHVAGLLSIPILDRSRGTGPDGDARLDLVRGQAGDLEVDAGFLVRQLLSDNIIDKAVKFEDFENRSHSQTP